MTSWQYLEKYTCYGSWTFNWTFFFLLLQDKLKPGSWSTIYAIWTEIIVKLICLHLLNSYFGFMCFNTVVWKADTNSQKNFFLSALVMWCVDSMFFWNVAIHLPDPSIKLCYLENLRPDIFSYTETLICKEYTCYTCVSLW